MMTVDVALVVIVDMVVRGCSNRGAAGWSQEWQPRDDEDDASGGGSGGGELPASGPFRPGWPSEQRFKEFLSAA